MKPFAAVISFLFAAFLCGSTFAHRVGADAYVSEDGTTIQVEAWISGGGAPKKGTVTVLGEDGREIAKGDLKEGVFRFTPQRKERFTFVVSLGEGHVKKFHISDTQFAKLRLDGGGEAAETASPAQRLSPTPFPSTRHHPEEEIRTLDRAILGLVLIISLTSLAIITRLNKRLRRLEQAISKSESRSRGDTPS